MMDTHWDSQSEWSRQHFTNSSDWIHGFPKGIPEGTHPLKTIPKCCFGVALELGSGKQKDNAQ